MEVLHTNDMYWTGAARVNPSHDSTDIKRRQERINKLQIVGKHTSHKSTRTVTHTFYVLGVTDFSEIPKS